MSGVLQAARISSFIYGEEETRRALRDVYHLDDEEISKVMRSLEASNN
jgi:hypothetical protein